VTILDRYILRQFIVSFLFGLLAILLVFLIIDMMEKLDDFMDAGASLKTVIDFYLAFFPEIIKLTTPVAVLLAALFVTGRLSGQNELAAMKSGGISLYRLMAPFAAVALLICLISVYFNGWIVPNANQRKAYIERTYLHGGSNPTIRYNILFQEGPNRIVSIDYFDIQARSAHRVSIQEFDPATETKLVRRLDAALMQWQNSRSDDAPENSWVLLSGSTHDFTDTTQTVAMFNRLPVGRLSLTPEDIEKKQRTPDEMDYHDLKEFIENQQRAGQDVARWLVEYHAKVAFPFASVIMVLFGVPFASARPRTGAALGFGISTAITFIYLIFMKASQVFGYNGDIHPLLTAWLANIIFFVAGIVNLLRVQK
jgi:lipopolysaccharide export system permease protein